MKKEIEGTKRCKHCQTEIPSGAKVCPNCRKKQGMGCLPKVLIAVVVVVILALIAVNGSGDSQSGIDNSGAADSAKKTETAETEEKDTSEESDVVKVGGSYQGDGLKFIVEDADLNYTVKNNEYGFYDLDKGLRYVAVDFTFENTGDSDKYVSIYDFDCYADDSNCEQQYLSDSDDFVNTNLSSGRKVSFTTFYAVPEDAESIELEYTANIWTDEKIVVKLK